jgi:hypothetical protein
MYTKKAVNVAPVQTNEIMVQNHRFQNQNHRRRTSATKHMVIYKY